MKRFVMFVIGLLLVNSLSVYSQTLKEKAESGDKVAQYKYGVQYANGQGVIRSNETAFFWFKKSADQGFKHAEYAVGRSYYYGKGTTRNLKLAVEWFYKAAAQEHSAAMFYLGECYSHGYGVAKNMEKAVEWYEKSAEDDDTDAEYALALLYLQGNGVEKDSIFATELLLHSAGGGYCCTKQLFTYNKDKANKDAQKKLLELSSIKTSPKRHHFLAMAGCLYHAMEDYTNAEKCYKQAIANGSYLGIVELGLMYFYVAANDPQLYKGYYNPENDESEMESELGLESYRFDDNTACLDFVRNKLWSNEDNIAYWLERAIDEGFGSFRFGSMPYNVYEHLLFTYVEGIGVEKNLDRAVDIAELCISDTTIESDFLVSWNALTVAVGEKELQTKVFQVYQRASKMPVNNERTEDYHALSVAELADCYYHGIGTAKNYNLAFKYLLEATNDEHNQHACDLKKMLAECYRYGRGTAVNKVKENEWLKKASECNGE